MGNVYLSIRPSRALTGRFWSLIPEKNVVKQRTTMEESALQVPLWPIEKEKTIRQNLNNSHSPASQVLGMNVAGPEHERPRSHVRVGTGDGNRPYTHSSVAGTPPLFGLAALRRGTGDGHEGYPRRSVWGLVTLRGTCYGEGGYLLRSGH